MLVSVTFECVTICDICDHHVSKSVLLEKLNKTQRTEGRQKFETFCDRHKCHRL